MTDNSTESLLLEKALDLLMNDHDLEAKIVFDMYIKEKARRIGND